MTDEVNYKIIGLDNPDLKIAQEIYARYDFDYPYTEIVEDITREKLVEEIKTAMNKLLVLITKLE